MEKIIAKLCDKDGISDIHIHAGLPIAIRVYGNIEKIADEIIEKDEINKFIKSVLNTSQFKVFSDEKSFDCSFTIGKIRMRANMFESMHGPSLALRVLEDNIRDFHEVGFPPVIEELITKRNGLILVTGPTGSGKSTSLAAMINYLNENHAMNIITIEDPIEYIHANKQAIISQREVGAHTSSFASALRAALREDPDAILVGELRDIETITLALTAAETGHMVFATLHTNGASQTINRIIDVFPGDQRGQVRQQLSTTLRVAVTQRLIKRMDGVGRVPAFEVMVCNSAVKNLIREDKVFQIPSSMQTGPSDGMIRMESTLDQLKADGIISYDEE